jgi:hypothetical protein
MGSRIERAVAVVAMFKKKISCVFWNRALNKGTSLTLAPRDSVALAVRSSYYIGPSRLY